MDVATSTAIRIIEETRSVSYSEGGHTIKQYHIALVLNAASSAVASVTLLTWDVLITLSDEVSPISIIHTTTLIIHLAGVARLNWFGGAGLSNETDVRYNSTPVFQPAMDSSKGPLSVGAIPTIELSVVSLR
jgi:hypothetical protein